MFYGPLLADLEGKHQHSVGDSDLHQPITDTENRAVLAELEKVLADARFAGSPSLIRFLRHTVSETLAGRTSELREGPLGLSVFDRGVDFDSRLDPIVRVQARKLRARLQDYYEHEGASDSIRIELPRGSYVPRFTRGPGGLDPAAAQTGLAESAGRALPARPRPARSLAWAMAPAAVLLAVLAWTWLRGRPSPPPPLELTRLTYEAGSTMWPVLSRDGKLLAYSSDRGKGDLNIWLQPVHGGSPLQLTQHESPALSPDFSPDGMWIAFRTRHSGGGIATVSVLGGEERRIADGGWLPRYSPDGAWIAYQGSGALYVVPSGGGPSRAVASGDIELRAGPLWDPDGKHLLALGTARSAANGPLDWYAVPWTGGKPVSIGLRQQLISQGLPALAEEARPSDWLGAGIVFAMRRGAALNIWRAPVNPRTLQIAGPLVQLTSGSSFDSPRCSPAGQVVFYNEVRMTHLYSLPVDRMGRALRAPEQLTEDSSLTPNGPWPRLSADSARVAYVSTRSGLQQVVLRDLASGKESASVTPVRQDLSLVAGDGSVMVYRGRDPDRQVLYVAEPGQPVAEDAGELCGAVHDWSPDGRIVLLEAPSREALIVWDRDSGRRLKWLEYKPGSLRRASLSQDRKWVALVFSDPPGGFVAPLTTKPVSPEHLIRVSLDSHLTSLHWSSDGSLLYFFSPSDDHNCLWAQRLSSVTGHPSGAPFPVYHFHSNRLAAWGDSISAGAGRLILPLTELVSDIWMATPGSAKAAAAGGLR